MARLLLFALCVLPSAVSAWSMGNPFHVQGRVYCDTCQCGFETIKTAYITGATVRIECRDRTDLQLRYSLEGVTDSNGAYKIKVVGDQADRICHVVLVDSPLADCKKCRPNEALPGCAELVKKLLESDE
ncbi:hypothetical protein OIU77_018884 [Salix suchowensis]|uniref:Uncharacterized protein n=1 Tax=Salix suchowensis TaxID=1278906 RepID=A0ABQ9CI61_9ROSI|nr:hypothetical protein OIU77_018884 [Salix suchowensis]